MTDSWGHTDSLSDALSGVLERQRADVGPSETLVWIETEDGESLVYDSDGDTDEWVRSDVTITDPDAGGVDA